jgi:hypothetical protein
VVICGVGGPSGPGGRTVSDPLREIIDMVCFGVVFHLCTIDCPGLGAGPSTTMVTMGSKFYTIRFKDQIELGSSPISIHF